jgi:penicillin-binding protein 1A
MLQKLNAFLRFKHSWFSRVVKFIWILLIILLIGIPLYVYSVRIDLFGLFGGMPSLKAIENPENDLSSELISADGVSLGRYHFLFNRSQVTFDQLSNDLVHTVLYSEDHRFYNHSGLDFQAYLRVILGVLTANPAQGGGSTITQQLAKNLFTQDTLLDGTLGKHGKLPKRIIQKTKEWIISVHLEKNFTKEEIMTMYLNTASFSSNAYGIKAAAETYFQKQPYELNLQESAVLVGMLQNPSLFNPRYRPENAFKKRNQVLRKALKHGYIKSQAIYDSLIQLPIELKYSVRNQNVGPATYFRTAIEKELFLWCKERGYNLYESGLKIYVTIDSRLQHYAEGAMKESMKPQQEAFDAHWKNNNPWIDETGTELAGFLESRIKRTDAYRILVKKYGQNSDSVSIMLNVKKPMTIFTWNGERDTLFSSMDSLRYYKRFLHAGFMSMDAQTGAIRAWVGGINHKYFKFDHVRQGKRPPGSTFKPFVYGMAMEAGYTPCFKLQDISPTINLPGGGTWTPPNARGDRGTGQWLTLRKALALSKNSITTQLLQLVGAENIVDFARRAGIKSPLDTVPSLCLGVSNVSLYELLSGYSTFVDLGIHTEPFYISRIEDKHGNVIENSVPVRRQAISEQTAFKMVYMLMGGVEEEGGNSEWLSESLKTDNEIGAKTGTTNNASDGWYVGITHNLVSGGWVGGDEPSIHYRDWVLGQGGRTSKPIWEKYMLKVYADKTLEYKKGQFRRPAELDVTIDCKSFDNSKEGPEFNPND